MPMDRRLYPENWEAIALAVKQKAGWHCEECSRPCRRPGESWWDFYQRIEDDHRQWAKDFEGEDKNGEPILKQGRFTLTVAHLDHDPENPNARLKALCSVCHCRYDLKAMATKRRIKQERNGQLTLAIGEEEAMIESEIRILSLWQPWASFIALGIKKFETRSWQTPYRGKLAIHAAKRPIDEIGEATIWDARNKGASIPNISMPLGCIVALADLTACLKMVDDLSRSPSEVANIHLQTQLELSVGDWRPGRYAWKLGNICSISEPIPFKGGQGLRVIRDGEVLAQICHLRHDNKAMATKPRLNQEWNEQLTAIGEDSK